MFESPWSVVILLLVLGWLVQFVFSYFQMKNFYSRLTELRRDGLLAVGKGGGQYRGRVYGVLVVKDDLEQTVVHAEKLSGATVFARLRPVPELEGRPLAHAAELIDEISLSKKLREAFASAAADLQAAALPLSDAEQPA